ncbi:MAG: hypothetical protein ACLR6J_14360 [Parabacteroides merdae]
MEKRPTQGGIITTNSYISTLPMLQVIAYNNADNIADTLDRRQCDWW